MLRFADKIAEIFIKLFQNRLGKTVFRHVPGHFFTLHLKIRGALSYFSVFRL